MIGRMPARERLLEIGRRRGERLNRKFGEDVRELRIGLGLSQRELSAALSVSASKLARWERALPPHPDLIEAAVVMRLLGQDFVASPYPAGGALRDRAHAQLVSAFLGILPTAVTRRLESPVPMPGDLRAWDVLLRLGPAWVGVAVETRLRDWQALYRREEAKARDSGVDRILFVLLDSRANRRAVGEAGRALREALPLDGRAILPALRSGRDPGANGLIFLSK